MTESLPFPRNLPAYRALQERKAELARLGIVHPYFRLHEERSGVEAVIEGKRCVTFSSYDYLGLSHHPAVTGAARDAIDAYGTSVSASRVVSGEIPPHRRLEAALADALGTEDCVVFISGYGANVSAIGHLVGPRDLVLFDSQIHISAQNGAQLSGARTLSFGHNDLVRLERILQQRRADFDQVLIVVEGAYSMEGDIADLPGLVALKKRYDALLMVDEAHSFGVLGSTGLGAREHFSLPEGDIDIWMGTLSKSLAASGGYIAGSAALVEYLKFTAPGFVFSVALPPANTAAALAALETLRREPERAARVQARAKLFLDRAKERGLDTGKSGGTPIVPVIVGDPALCLRLAEALFEQGISVFPIIPPGVTAANSRLRFFITADHGEEQIMHAVDATARLLAELKR